MRIAVKPLALLLRSSPRAELHLTPKLRTADVLAVVSLVVMHTYLSHRCLALVLVH